MLKRIMDGLPKKASFYQDLAIDNSGLIYVFLANPTAGPIQGIDIFSSEGKYLYSSQLRVEDGSSIQAIYLRDDLLVIAVEDEEGTVKVAQYSVQLPGAPWHGGPICCAVRLCLFSLVPGDGACSPI
jgi:hypothetical protein